MATKVLSIVGPGRSGTTVLAGILGESEGALSVGELRWLWRRGLLERRSCGCGLPPAECPLWSKVTARVLARHPVAVSEIAAAQDEVATRRNRLRAIRSAYRRDTEWPALQLVRGVTGDLVDAVAEEAGVHLIIDSSKRAQDAAVLAGLDGVDQYVLQMVRDPGAVAFSWQRKDKQIRVAEGTRAMATRRVVPSIARWVENCLSAEALRRQVPADRWLFVRYEDFAAAPRTTIAEVLAFLGEPATTSFTTESTVVLRPNHTVAGNPNRFKVGEITVRVDDEWRRRLPRASQVLVRLLTWPLLLRYGYLRARSSRLAR